MENFIKHGFTLDFEIGYFDFHSTSVEVKALSDKAKSYLGGSECVGCNIKTSQLAAWVNKLENQGYKIM